MRMLIMLALYLLCLDVAPAQALRCGNRLVSAGEAKLSVWQKCGEPEATDWYVTYRALRGPEHSPVATPPVYVPVVIELWFYNFGPQRFQQEFSFEEGRLIGIRPLGYGF
jgi:hypothetical protein